MSNRAIVRKASRTIATNVRLPEAVWHQLRMLAEERASRVGGRPSASAVLAELVIGASGSRRRAA